MESFANKIMNLSGQRQRNTGQPSAIFGTAGTLRNTIDTRPPVRIGVWPLISKEEPEVAMGLMTVIALFLNRWRSVRVYKLFVKLQGEPDVFIWNITDSQFEVEEWELDSLDDNVGLWGTLERDSTNWFLKIELENDMDDETDVIDKFEYKSTDIAGLARQIPAIAQDIITKLDVSDSVLDIAFDKDVDDNRIRAYLKTVFSWERQLILSLWGRAWGEDDIITHHDSLLNEAVQLNHDVGAWSATAATTQAMQAGYGHVADVLIKRATMLVENFPEFDITATSVAGMLYRRGYVEQGINILESVLEKRTSNIAAWLTLAELYRQSGRMQNALDTYQTAIEKGAVNFLLYVNYANLLVNMEYDGWEIEDYVLHDTDKVIASQGISWEVIEAYEKALTFEPDRTDVMEQQIIRFVDVGAINRLWDRFKQLVQLDEKDDNISSVVDAFYDLNDAEPAIRILKDQYKTNPTRHHLLLSLASLYLIEDDIDAALDTLDQASEKLNDPASIAQINRLTVLAEDPDFEMRLAEMRGIVDAGNTISSDDADYLEDILERAPDFGEVYVVLAKAYLAWGEDEDALDTLLDGYDRVPEDAELVALLGEVLWDAEQGELALKYLNENVKLNPNSVDVLALLGQYTFELGDEDTARTFMQRAEAISPRHPAVQKARIEITKMMNEDDMN